MTDTRLPPYSEQFVLYTTREGSYYVERELKGLLFVQDMNLRIARTRRVSALIDQVLPSQFDWLIENAMTRSSRDFAKWARRNKLKCKDAHADLKLRFQAALRKKQQLRAQNKVKPTHTPDELLKAIEWANSLEDNPIAVEHHRRF